MTPPASSAFRDEIRTQRQVALQELASATAAGDETGVAEAAGRVRDLEELARRNDAWPWLDLALA